MKSYDLQVEIGGLRNLSIILFGVIDSRFGRQQYDTNRDGRVSRHEYTEYTNLHTPTLYALSHALYDIYDVDNDHHLDLHDFENFFRLLDSNADNMVNEDEFVR